MTSDVERLGREQYVRLTTFRRDGTPVATPTWVAHDGAEVYVWSARDAGKVKRVRAGSKAELIGCDLRGGKTHGEPATGTPRLLDNEDSERVRKLIIDKYGIVGWFTIYASILRGGRKRTIGIAITLDA